jgi:hypothetical protein
MDDMLPLTRSRAELRLSEALCIAPLALSRNPEVDVEEP